MRVKNSTERRVDHVKHKSIGPLSICPLSNFNAGTIPPDIDASKQELTFKSANPLKPSSMTILPLLLILAIDSSYTMVHANTNEIRKTE